MSAEQDAHFRAGVGACLARWTALRLAVESGWGGRRGEGKAEDLREEVVRWFYRGGGEKYADELEDLLDEYLIQQFSMEVEDGSLREVSEKLVEIYYDCAEGNFESVRELQGRAAQSGSAVESSRKAPGDDNDDDDDDDDDDDVEIADVEGVNDVAQSGGASRVGGEAEGGARPQSESRPNLQTLSAEEIAEGWEVAPSKGRRTSRGRP